MEEDSENKDIMKKSNTLRETFGTLKFSKSVEEMMKETDEELYDI